MLKRLFCLSIAFILMVSVFAGCGGQKVSENTTSENTEIQQSTSAQTTQEAVSSDSNSKAFEISVSSWALIDEKEDIPYKASILYKQEVEKVYKEKYPNATIQWNNMGNEKYFDVLKAKLASDTADDVFFHQNALVSFAKAGYLADLTNEAMAADILDSTKSAVTYKGKIYAMPQSVAGWGCWYNKKMFEDNGWTVPKTWDEFLKLCDTIKAKGISPLIGGFKDVWTLFGWLAADCVDVQGANPNFETDLYSGKTKINGPEYIKLMNKLETIVQKGYYNKNALSINWDQSRVELGAGKGAMILQGSWLPGTMKNEYPDFKCGYMQIPDENGNTMVSFGVNSVISANQKSKQLDKAKDLVAALMDKKALEIYLKDSNFAGVKGTNVEYSMDATKEYAAALNSGKSVLQITTFMPPSVSTILNNIQTAIIAGKKFDPASLDEAQKAYESDINLIEIP